jgi:AcrR family transcriptional regulator
MATSAQPNVNEPRQRRSRETRDRLLQATRELLEERTFEDLTIQQIATRAGCPVGAFYGRFGGKEAILPQLLQMHYAEVEREVSTAFRPEAWLGAPLERRVDAVVDHLLSVAQRQPGLIRTLVLRNYQRPGTIPASIRAAARRAGPALRRSPRGSAADGPSRGNDRGGGGSPDGRRRHPRARHPHRGHPLLDPHGVHRGPRGGAEAGPPGVPDAHPQVREEQP